MLVYSCKKNVKQVAATFSTVLHTPWQQKLRTVAVCLATAVQQEHKVANTRVL